MYEMHTEQWSDLDFKASTKQGDGIRTTRT